MTQRTVSPNPVTVPVSPELLREQLLRPLPRIGLRAFVLFLLVVALLSWSVNSTETSLTTLVSGLPDVWNFIVRLFPPEFELARGTQRTFINGGETFDVSINTAEDTIRPLYETEQPIYIYSGDQPIPVRQRDLPQTISLLRNDGVETIRYVVGASGFTIGWPSIITAVVETIQMALIGTIGAVLLAIPFGLLAAKNVSPHPLIYQSTRFILNIMRS
ncbi:MAG: hypothetical protein H7175_06990, partial [Burkholderiales bacterium]|nr:hypothetical protein [Anaerolineae bacterium]